MVSTKILQLFLTWIIINVSWAPNQIIKMISEESCDTEFSFAITEINNILKCIKIEKLFNL